MTSERVLVTAPTEERNPRTVAIDEVSTEELIALIQAEDARVIPAVVAVRSELARLVDIAAERVGRGGKVHYFGAGTSGRLGVIDAAEVVPTYGVDGLIIAHHAGGPGAFVTAVENVEDDESAGAREAAALGASDVAIGIAASGRTPFVAGALRAARAHGAATALITANPRPGLAELADILIAPATGAEAITGSTRMKAGTAAKLVLGAFSTALMVRLGRTYSNLMITMRPTNAKLRGRAVHMLEQATGEPAADCAAALDAAGEIPAALVLLLAGLTPAQADRARAALAQAGGRVRAAVAALAQH